jgi:hypothetical protein
VHLKSSLIRGMAFVDTGLIKGVLIVHLKGGHSFIVDGVVLFMWDEQFKVEESCHISNEDNKWTINLLLVLYHSRHFEFPQLLLPHFLHQR